MPYELHKTYSFYCFRCGEQKIHVDKATVREELPVRRVTKIFGQFEEKLEKNKSF
jgi:hypothetical protein